MNKKSIINKNILLNSGYTYIRRGVFNLAFMQVCEWRWLWICNNKLYIGLLCLLLCSCWWTLGQDVSVLSFNSRVFRRHDINHIYLIYLLGGWVRLKHLLSWKILKHSFRSPQNITIFFKLWLLQIMVCIDIANYGN